ncbi:MAG: serine hydroxymethyltransferase [Planctomycetota bacterium]|nr:serine hydroxymethyltransferase [Planctomycetota bacterium]MEC9030656.1 serine hydroxymethyltransferase [Planctomycetota bacterium]MEE3296683.1 serine hydroxymethyltransferase [Planctomycetota bacterium]
MSDLSAIEITDPEIKELICREEARQLSSIRLIASENYASEAVMQATGTVLTNKYSEGYAGKRYYEGQDYIDQVETLAIERAKALFGAEHANVQPYSGSPANQAVYLALCQPGDTIMGMSLPFGGHLTHGWKVNFSGIQYKSVQYELSPDTHRIDLDQVREMALEHRPRLIWTGASAYPRTWDFEAFAEIAAEVDAVLVADIAHFSGLVAGGVHPHPFPHASIVTTTTHKTLRGPRGGMILSKEEYARDLDRAIFPGLQGGPHNHTTAAIAVALKEASSDDFKDYARRIVANAQALAASLLERGFSLVTGGTDNHLILFDATAKGLSGKEGSSAMNLCGIEANSNAIPFDPRKPFDPSGIRLGTASVTSRGMNEEHMKQVADWIEQSFEAHEDPDRLQAIREEISEFCSGFPCPGIPT